jgi:ParB-like chromosome segregation protein Spo0J
MTDHSDSQDPDSPQLDLGFDTVEPELKSVPLSAICPTSQSSDPAIESSVDALGLLSVPVLQPREAEGSGEENRYRIVDGRRRVDAARSVGRDVIDAYVIGAAVGPEADALTVLLNLARSPSPLREAEALSDLVESGYTPEALARLGPAKGTIEKRLRLAAAPPVIKDGVREGEIAEGVAEKVANLSKMLQEQCVACYREEGRLRHKDVKDLRTAHRNAEAEALPDALFKTPDEDSTPDWAEAPTDQIDASLEEADRQALSQGEPSQSQGEPVPGEGSREVDGQTPLLEEGAAERALMRVMDAARAALDAGARPSAVVRAAKEAAQSETPA